MGIDLGKVSKNILVGRSLKNIPGHIFAISSRRGKTQEKPCCFGDLLISFKNQSLKKNQIDNKNFPVFVLKKHVLVFAFKTTTVTGFPYLPKPFVFPKRLGRRKAMRLMPTQLINTRIPTSQQL